MRENLRSREFPFEPGFPDVRRLNGVVSLTFELQVQYAAKIRIVIHDKNFLFHLRTL